MNYTQVPNWMLDEALPKCTASEWKILCAIVRKTNGWNKASDRISYRQFDDMTGISNRKTISVSISGLIEKGFIGRNKCGKQCFSYQVTSYKIAPVVESGPVTKSHRTGYKIAPEPVTKSHQQKKKETLKKESVSSSSDLTMHEVQVGEPDPVDELMNHFAAVASRKRDFPVKLPTGKELSKPWIREAWDETAKDILQFFRNDLSASKLAVEAAISWNFERKLSIDSPKSIRKTAFTINRNDPDTYKPVKVSAI